MITKDQARSIVYAWYGMQVPMTFDNVDYLLDFCEGEEPEFVIGVCLLTQYIHYNGPVPA